MSEFSESFKNANRNPISYSTARYRRPSPAISLSTQQILAQQRQSESRVAMTMQPHGRLRSGVLDARWRLSRWMMRKERSCLEILHQMLERRSPREDDFLLSKPLQMSAFLERSSPGETHQASARLPFNYFKLSKGQIFYSYCCKYY